MAAGTPNDLTVRPLAATELDLFVDMPGHQGPRHPNMDRDFFATIATSNYRPEWTWVAQRDGRVVARAAWWGFPQAEHPLALDWFDMYGSEDRIGTGAHLLRVAGEQLRTIDGQRPQYIQFLPPRWRDEPSVRAVQEDRMKAALDAGMELLVERLHYEWTPNAGRPRRSTRLRFEAVRPDATDEILDVLVRIQLVSLDVLTSLVAARLGVVGAARWLLADMDALPGPREWWRLAFTSDGELVGISMPSRNFEDDIIGYIGVVPEQRGHHYADDLLAEATAILAEMGSQRVTADTDTTNTPMAASFERAGYRNVGIRIVMG